MRRLVPIISCVFLLLPGVAAASEYLGDFCWQRQGGMVLTLGLSRVGGGHYLVTGSADNSLPGEITSISGSATVHNQQLFMNLHFTGEDDERFFAGSGRVVVDIESFDGTFEFVEVAHPKQGNPGEANAVHFSKESLTPVTCN